MDNFPIVLISLAASIWLIILLLPWRPWLNTEILEPATACNGVDLSEVTVLIPARNEAEVIESTLYGLASQGHGLRVVLVDDGSEDGTAVLARKVEGIDLVILRGEDLPPGWSGKLWALEQGIRGIGTKWTLLLDADIRLAPGMVVALLDKAGRDNRQLVSIMAHLRMESFWEKWLMPAFIYFFKLLYPFRLANSDNPFVAAAAGGCILLETRLIGEIGGFAAIRTALIDDCTLARHVKRAGNRIWLGQSHGVVSLRRYDKLGPIWDMVARCAFTQLRYSGWLLGACTAMLALMFLVPPAGIFLGEGAQALSIAAYCFMVASYWPTVRFYGLNGGRALLLPIVAVFYLAMTWTSAARCWRGDRSRWKNRTYAAHQ